jgi:hypothetical protein
MFKSIILLKPLLTHSIPHCSPQLLKTLHRHNKIAMSSSTVSPCTYYIRAKSHKLPFSNYSTQIILLLLNIHCMLYILMYGVHPQYFFILVIGIMYFLLTSFQGLAGFIFVQLSLMYCTYLFCSKERLKHFYLIKSRLFSVMVVLNSNLCNINFLR